jgi:phosphoribosylamine--glycine ligase
MLQEKVDGVEVGVSRWMGTQGFVGPYNENFEFKKLMSGNAGPNCGEAGTVMKYVEDSKLGQAVLAALEESLVKLGHLGDIDVNCIVDEKGRAWPLEFTMRLGWPAFNIQLATTSADPAQWMLDACEGRDTLKVRWSTACGVVLTQPAYPFHDKPPEELAVLPDMKDGKVIERQIWATAGDYLMVVTGTGRTVRQAATRAYDTLGQLSVADMSYRDDIGEKLEEELPKLHEHGYATEFSYE